MCSTTHFTQLKLFRFIAALILCISAAVSTLANAADFPNKPPSRSFVVDDANLISTADKRLINHRARELLQDERVPIYIVTVKSLRDYDFSYRDVDQSARFLFNKWGIGYKHRNNGILLFVSQSERKARIELGADWDSQYDEKTKFIMDKVIIRRFKEGKFSEGILEGAAALDGMARGANLPPAYRPAWVNPALAMLAVLSLCLGLSLIRSGQKGWGWAFIVFAIVLIIDVIMSVIDGHDGGGFSSGGGASGGW